LAQPVTAAPAVSDAPARAAETPVSESASTPAHDVAVASSSASAAPETSATSAAPKAAGLTKKPARGDQRRGRQVEEAGPTSADGPADGGTDTPAAT
jgi:hypothetical protein